MPYSFRRSLVAQIEEFLGLEQNLMVMVMGARRTGKTTAVKQVLDIVETRNWGMLFHSFDPVFEAQSLPEPSRFKPERPAQGDLGSVWQQARQQARRQGHPVVLVLDEIQGVPEWQHLAKQLWDQDRYLGSSLKVVITGSAPLLLAAGAAAELQGGTCQSSVPTGRLRKWRKSFPAAWMSTFFRRLSFCRRGGCMEEICQRHNRQLPSQGSAGSCSRHKKKGGPAAAAAGRPAPRRPASQLQQAGKACSGDQQHHHFGPLS